MKSITMVTCRVRAWASAVIRSIRWLLPSTRATQVRSWSGSRRSASAKIWATTDAASATTLAVSLLFDVTGPGWIWARSVSSTGRMSALVRGAAVASNTVPTSAIRFRFRFSPLDSRVVSFGRVLAAAAAKTRPKLTTRLSKGEKRNRKRMAEVGTVVDATAAPRTSADILPVDDTERAQIHPGPVTSNKWLTASVVADAASVVAQIFAEADRRDPDHDRTWVALVDGNNHQIDRITAEAHARTLQVTIVIDFIHVLEYIWKAAWCFHREGDPAAEEWVRHHARAVLDGKATRVAGAIRRAATIAGLHDAQRAGADACAVYLTNKAHYLDYPTALASGWPIATGVIEGACRHLVKDRMDLTGARWGLPGAEAILKLRAIASNGDFDDYWRHHLAQERHRVHETRYAQDVIPQAE